MRTLEGFILLSEFEFFRDFKKLANLPRKKTESLPKEIKDLFSEALLNQRKWMLDCGLSTTPSLAMNLSAELSQMRFTAQTLSERLQAIDSTFRAELASHLFLHLDEDKKKYYVLLDPFGTDVSRKYSSATYDICEAAKCHALERPTACVLHLMRVLEIGLSTLAKSLGLRFNEPTWNLVLDKIEKRIRTIEKLKRKPKEWKKHRQFYSEAAADFRFLKDAWRNYAMHARQTYKMEEAKRIYDHVHAFMRHLSTTLKE